jgi:N6-adenosine-specific RNA methylase IME4
MNINWKENWPDQKYEIIYADPPWDYDNRVQHGGKSATFVSGAISYYPTLTIRELCNFDVRGIAKTNSLLYMWATGPQIERAINLAKVWGFSFKTIAFVWDKKMVNPGSYTMSQCEYVLCFKRGSIPKPRGARNVRQYVGEARGKHSEKPIEVRTRIEIMHPTQTKIELFARRGGRGWDIWGKEAELGL